MTETNDGTKSNYTQNYYDARGNVLRVYTGLSAPLTINGLDNVVPNGDENYAVTKYTYDIKGNLISTTDALGNTVSYDVDLANKRIKSTTDKNQNTFVFEYDAIGNVTSKSLADGTNAETTVYGLTGQVLSKTNDTSSISYIYDNKGRLISESDSALGTVKTYTYDEAGNRLTFTLTRNGTTQMSQSYVYDKLNRLTSVSENGTVIATYTYDNKNNRTKTTVPNGETTNYSYNIANMLTSQTTGNKLNEQYTYYLNGNQKTKISNGETTNYIYDGMNRLVRENNTSYTFDDFGNRLTMSDGTATTAYTYDLNNRLISSTETNNGAVKNTSYSYDYNGNQISKLVTSTKALEQGKGETVKISDETDENVAFYEYNCYNQVIEADTNGVKSNYAYSPDGLRQSKTVDGNTITFVYDNANVVEEITQDGTNKYYRGFEIVKNDDNVYYLYNGQGDVAMLIDGTGKTVANYSFDAYGNQSEENTIYNPFGYRGEYQDNETGLIYLRNRYYDPATSRMLSEDPARQGTNWYIYCNNNPLKYIDPSGLYYLEKDSNGQVYAVIESGDTLSGISYSEVRDSTAYTKLNYADPGYLEVGQRVNITGIYNKSYPVPTNIMLSKTSHTQGDSGLRDIPDDEISRRARDKSLPGEERRRYQKEEKLRGQRNKQKRQSHYNIHQSKLPYPNTEFLPAPSQSYPTVNMTDSQFLSNVSTGVITVVGVAAGIYYFCYTGDPSIIYQYAY